MKSLFCLNPRVYLCCALAPTGEGIKEANASWGHQQQGKDDVVHRGEVHLDYLPHYNTGQGDKGCWKHGLWARLQRQNKFFTHRETHRAGGRRKSREIKWGGGRLRPGGNARLVPWHGIAAESLHLILKTKKYFFPFWNKNVQNTM